MEFVSITAPGVGDPTELDTFAVPVLENQGELIARITGIQDTSGVPNGSFELGSEEDTAPAGWGLSIAAGNSTAFELLAAATRHGRQAFRMTTPGGISGGVTLISDAFLLVAEGRGQILDFLLKCSVANTRLTVSMHYYDEAETFISAVTLYDEAAANPTSWADKTAQMVPPAGAKLAKLQFVGVNNTNAADIYLDGIRLKNQGLYKRTAYITGSGTHVYQDWARFRHVTGRGGGGGGGGNNADGGDGGETTLGSVFSAAGGNGGNEAAGTAGGGGGAAQAGAWSSDLLSLGSRAGGAGGNATGTAASTPGGRGSGSGFGAGGDGAASTLTSDGAGGGGAEGVEASYKGAVTGGASESYAIGAGGSASDGGIAGTGGYLDIEEFG